MDTVWELILEYKAGKGVVATRTGEKTTAKNKSMAMRKKTSSP
jgi:hypothetical protein